jgi:hypothetical protein
MASTVMRELHRLGPEALTPTKVKDLLALQHDYNKSTSSWHQPSMAAGDAIAGVQDASRKAHGHRMDVTRFDERNE